MLHVKNLEEVRFSAEVFRKCNNSDNSFLPFSLHRFLEFRPLPNSYYLELYSLKVYNYWNVAFVANKATITLVQSFIIINTIINTIILPEQQDKAWQQPEPKLCSSCDLVWTQKTMSTTFPKQEDNSSLLNETLVVVNLRKDWDLYI